MTGDVRSRSRTHAPPGPERRGRSPEPLGEGEAERRRVVVADLGRDPRPPSGRRAGRAGPDRACACASTHRAWLRPRPGTGEAGCSRWHPRSARARARCTPRAGGSRCSAARVRPALPACGGSMRDPGRARGRETGSTAPSRSRSRGTASPGCRGDRGRDARTRSDAGSRATTWFAAAPRGGAASARTSGDRAPGSRTRARPRRGAVGAR
jgi:hypothetical protein